MQAAMQRYAESGDLADLGDAHRWRSSGNRREGRAMSAFNWRTEREENAALRRVLMQGAAA